MHICYLVLSDLCLKWMKIHFTYGVVFSFQERREYKYQIGICSLRAEAVSTSVFAHNPGMTPALFSNGKKVRTKVHVALEGEPKGWAAGSSHVVCWEGQRG